jgi:hypothetical protein
MAVNKLAARDRHQLRLVVHSHADELRYLVPGAVVRPVPSSASSGPFCPLSAHPGFQDVRAWDPINPEEFRT